MSYDGLGPGELARRLQAPACLSLVKVTSTLDVVHELAAAGAQAGTVVIADEQVDGRGRQGRRWHSPPGTGVWLGFLVRPLAPVENGIVSLRAGLAVAETLQELNAQPRIKWPNDVLLDGRKVAGVLCEAKWRGDRLEWLALGIGLNVHGPLPSDLRPYATALDEHVTGVSRIAVLERLVPRLHRLEHNGRLSARERGRFDQFDWLSGRSVSQPVVGTVGGIDADGALIVETDLGVERIRGGSVVTA